MSIIKNFGEYWDREKIYWGSQRRGDKGHLNGYLARNKGNIVDFREQISIYCLYDETRNVVYVGQTGSGANDRLFHRLRAHRDDRMRSRWRYFSWFGLRQATNRGLHEGQKHSSRPSIRNNGGALDEIEFVLLRTIEPKLNLSSGNWRAHNIDAYIQWVENEEEDTTIAEKADIRELRDAVERIQATLSTHTVVRR